MNGEALVTSSFELCAECRPEAGRARGMDLPYSATARVISERAEMARPNPMDLWSNATASGPTRKETHNERAFRASWRRLRTR